MSNSIVVEVDGPTHYYIDVVKGQYQPNGFTMLKTRQVKSVDRMPVVNIPAMMWRVMWEKNKPFYIRRKVNHLLARVHKLGAAKWP